MPDILSTEKSTIRALAKKYAQALWTLPFDRGIVAYVKTNSELFVHPARWRYCFKCGMILKASLTKSADEEDETINHSCVLEFEDVPLLIKTSWIKLRDFFLNNSNHNHILNEIGIPDLPKPIISELEAVAELSKEELPEITSEESQ